MRILERLFGSEEESEEQTEPQPEGACNEVGHHYAEAHNTSVFSRTRTYAPWDVKVYLKRYLRCTKCDKLETEEETVAKFSVDTETGEVTRL